jgi:hypothetical protein
MARGLRDHATTRPDMTTLRTAQTQLVNALNSSNGNENDIQTAAWIDASDRITDSVDTLAHVLRAQSPRK